MNNIAKKLSLIFILVCVLILSTLSAQNITYSSTQMPQIKMVGSVNVSEIDDKFMPNLLCVAPAEKSGDSYRSELEKQKVKIAEAYPKSDQKIAKKRSYVSTPEVLLSFQVRNVLKGIPLDNHLAMSGDNIVTSGNFYMSINDRDGNQVQKFTLQSFADAAGVGGTPFDPRLAYDREAERWVFNFLSGNSSNQTHVVVAFSETSDPLGDWNIYRIEGNPNGINEWTDYPMISMTNDHVYVTINLLRDNESWQLGFVETLIWEISKESGYNGEDLDVTKYENIKLNGNTIRNVCPAESATEEIYDDIYFLSDRNFSIENDTFILMKLDPTAADPADRFTAEYVLSDTPYGAPPNASQTVGTLATNDARVLEAFRLGNHLQFVGNTRNLDNNKAGIFHAILEDATNPTAIKLNHIIGDDFELGYPGIVYTGQSSDELDAIIVVSHSSETRFPGISALYSYPGEGYSELVSVEEGTNYIDMQSNTTLERWGDYVGSQRDHDNPDEVWTLSTISKNAKQNLPYVGHLRRPSEPTGVFATAVPKVDYTIYPNPAVERISVDFSVAPSVTSIQARLYSSTGNFIGEIYETTFIKAGENNFSFDASSLESGSYVLNILVDGQQASSKSFMKN